MSNNIMDFGWTLYIKFHYLNTNFWFRRSSGPISFFIDMKCCLTIKTQKTLILVLSCLKGFYSGSHSNILHTFIMYKQRRNRKYSQKVDQILMRISIHRNNIALSKCKYIISSSNSWPWRTDLSAEGKFGYLILPLCFYKYLCTLVIQKKLSLSWQKVSRDTIEKSNHIQFFLPLH